MNADGDAYCHEDGHEISAGELDELFGFADQPELLQVCERGRAAFSEAVIENSRMALRGDGAVLTSRPVGGQHRRQATRPSRPIRRTPRRTGLHGSRVNRVLAGVTGTQRTKLVSDLRKQYEKGVSIRALAERTGRSYGFVRRILSESGVQLRGRGGATRSKKET